MLFETLRVNSLEATTSLTQGGNRVHLVNLLERSEVDIAVMGRPPEKMATRAELFAAHPHVFIAAPGHPLASQDEVSVMSLLSELFISREQGSGTQAALEKFLQLQTIERNIAMEAD